MILEKYSIHGQTRYGPDEKEVLVTGDPRRPLVRYRNDGGESYVHTRINVALLADAKALPVMRVMPVPDPSEVLAGDGLLTGNGSIRNYEFRDDLEKALGNLGCPACRLAERHGEGRRDFFFTTEDSERFATAVAAAGRGMKVDLRITTFAEAAIEFLPWGVFGELGVPIAAGREQQKVRFGFWGANETLARLRKRLEKRGYSFVSLEVAIRELRMMKSVSVEPAPFLATLREVATLSRGLNCSYRGEETVEGSDQFLLARTFPEKYGKKATSFFGRMFEQVFGQGSA